MSTNWNVNKPSLFRVGQWYGAKPFTLNPSKALLLLQVSRVSKESYMLVLAIDVSHSPATPITSRPANSWLKKRGWPGKGEARTVHRSINFSIDAWNSRWIQQTIHSVCNWNGSKETRLFRHCSGKHETKAHLYWPRISVCLDNPLIFAQGCLVFQAGPD